VPVSIDALPVPYLGLLLSRQSLRIHVEHANTLALSLLKTSSVSQVQRWLTEPAASSLHEALIDSVQTVPGTGTATVTAPEGSFYQASFRITSVTPESYRVSLTLNPATPADHANADTQEHWLAALPEANPNIVIIVCHPNRIEYVNPTGRRWLTEHGAQSSDALRALFPQELAGTVWDACGAGAHEWTTEHEGRNYDVKMTPLSDEKRCMLAINDVTEIRALAREHELFAQALQSAKTAMLITDDTGRIEFVNTYFEILYGYTMAEVVGKRPSVLNPGRRIYHELGYEEAEYDELFASMWHDIQDPEVGFWEGELPNQAKDGRIVWVRLLVHAVQDEKSGSVSYLGFPVDISQARFRERQVRMEIYQAITELAELRDNETGFHIQRVGRYARLIAAHLGASRRFQEDILSFAPLHDIGKVGIPDDLLLAPRRLSEEEFVIMKRHAELGYELLKEKPTMEMAADIAFGHHERWDGTGYPQGINGENIPLAARIVSVCDVYDALRSLRPYKRSWSHEAAVEAILAGRGTQFDPTVVDAFMALEEQFAHVEQQLQDATIA